MLTLHVNGRDELVEDTPRSMLLDVLRNQLGILSARFGCGQGLCGACSVLVDGRRVTACDTPLDAVLGREIVTVEGLGTKAAPHPVQAAFVAEQAMQCGYCSSGMIIGAVALLIQTPEPNDDDIRRSLDPLLCRCGAHLRIIKAVRRASAAIRTPI